MLGEINPQTGYLIDFGEIKQIVKPYVDMLDHWCINEVGERDNIELLKNPTSENIAKWYFETLKPKINGLHSILIHETCTTKCEYKEKF